MKYVMLKDVCAINMGQSPNSNSYNDIGDGVPFFQGNADFGEKYPITRKWCTEPTKMAKIKDILISVRAPIGAMNYAKEECCIGRGLAALTPNQSKVSTEFLYWLLKRKNKELNIKGTGSTFKAIGKTVLEDILIPDISLEEQNEVSSNLERIYAMIQNRKVELKLLDDLIKSRFVEMFDSLERTTTIARYILELRGGKSLAGTAPCKNKVLKTGAATFGRFDPEQYKYLPVDYEPLIEHRVETGDVIISRMNTPDLVGACSYVFDAPENMYYPDRLWKAVLQEDTNPIFLWQLLWACDVRDAIKKKSSGTSGTMHNISKPNLLAIKCIDVPIELQNQFADFVCHVDKLKLKSRAPLDKAWHILHK